LAASASAEEIALTLGVAPFESVAPPGDTLPDLAALLADRLGTRGVQRIVGPSQLGAAADAEPEPSAVQTWASAADVESIVVGRTTRIGSQLAVDVRLRSGQTGEVAGTFVAEITRSEDLEDAVDRLAGQVVEGALALRAGGEQPSSDAAVAAAAGPEGETRAPLGLPSWDSNQPLSIRSDEMEAAQEQGRRRLVFTRNVRVEQGTMRMSSARLVALYPEGASQPDRLVADGSVRLLQGDRSARCRKATYDRRSERLTCEGAAEFQDGENRLTGEVIEIDLATDRVRVRGGASVTIQPGPAEQGNPEPAP
jgi:lipopolysaccharide export system protein LptA